MKLERFEYTPSELAVTLTDTVHRSFHYLKERDIITEEQYDDLVSQVIVSPLPNKSGMGQKIREFFFGNNIDKHDMWVFPIVELPMKKVEDEDETK